MLTRTRTVIARLLLAAALTGATLPLVACGESKAAPAVNAKNYPETAEGLDKLWTDLMTAVKAKDGKRVEQIAGSFLLPSPDAWFATTFGDEAGARLDTEYDGSFVPHFAPGAMEGLLEAELFGHRRGAFTGATADRSARSRRRTARPCSSTRSATCRWRCRRACCACCRSAR